MRRCLRPSGRVRARTMTGAVGGAGGGRLACLRGGRRLRVRGWVRGRGGRRRRAWLRERVSGREREEREEGTEQREGGRGLVGGKERRRRVQEEKVKGQIDCAQKKARRPFFFSCSPQLADATTAESVCSQFMGMQDYKRVTRRSRRSWGRTFDLGCPRRQGRPCRWPDETGTIAREGQFVESGRAEGTVGRAGDSLEAWPPP